ncbi:MAG TPA: sulfur oxidation c-type cytochrome SoxX [Xanthobacteraceae bacterium]|nr:sulfur oxidation c-type cytochrome SoxX [Xanthobacteraceae bacterium]
MKALGCVVGLAAAVVSPAASQAAPPLPPFSVVVKDGVATIPAPLTSEPGDPKAGATVVVDRQLGNCLSCHEIDVLRGEEFHGDVGPPLNGVAKRWDTATLRMIVVNPKKVFGEDTVMPAFYRVDGLNRVRPEFVGKPILTAQQVEDVVAFLAALK